MVISFTDFHGDAKEFDIHDLDLELWLKGYTYDWSEPVTNLIVREID